MGGRWRPNEFSSIHWVCLFTCFPWKNTDLGIHHHATPDANKSRLERSVSRLFGPWGLYITNPAILGTLGGFHPTGWSAPSSMKLLTGSSNPNSAFQVGRIHAAAETSKGYVFCTLFLLTIFSWTTTCSKWSWSQSCKLSSSKSCTPPKTNLTMENPPWMKMYFLWKIAIFQCHVSFQEGTKKTCVFPRLTIYNAQTSPS